MLEIEALYVFFLFVQVISLVLACLWGKPMTCSDVMIETWRYPA